MIRKTLIALFLLWWLPVSIFTTEKESMIKVAFLAKFPRYIAWPEKSGMNDTSKPFILAVIGENPIGPILEKAYSTGYWQINKKKVKIIYFKTPEEIKECHLLFISTSAKKDLSKILSITKNKPILTVGDTSGFAQKGVHINFYQFRKRLRFEINPFAIREASLSIAPSLLEIGKIIKPREKKK